MSKRRESRGHFCWSCARHRPNERFSGRGHRRHLCRDCQALGKEELAVRQQQRDIDRLLTRDGRIRREQRASFERYLTHADERVRRYAEEIERLNEERRRWWRETLEQERLDEELLEQHGPQCREQRRRADEEHDEDRSEQKEIPF